jgi:signal transduction histidine kinase
MGLGLVGARRLTDAFDVRTRAGEGTAVTMARALPRHAPPVTPARLGAIAEALARQAPRGAYEEVQAQNHELLRTLEELRARQAEVERLNAELAETNRGVLALYAELDDRAQALRLASEQKSRFLSGVSHELRTPLTSIVNLARLLAEGPGGRDLAEEQRTAVRFIRQSAVALTEIVNDLLDLAKIEAGKVELRPAPFAAAALVAALRGVFRPLATDPAVALRLEDPPPGLMLVTDEGRLAQVLRNLVGNALKYTEAGEVRLTILAEPGDVVAFAVRDTGIGIAPADQARVFDEFAQVEHPLQGRTKGTGLGLPLSRRLAGLLGGTLTLESAPGAGSTFTVRVPRALPAAGAAGAAVAAFTGGPAAAAGSEAARVG